MIEDIIRDIVRTEVRSVLVDGVKVWESGEDK